MIVDSSTPWVARRRRWPAGSGCERSAERDWPRPARSTRLLLWLLALALVMPVAAFAGEPIPLESRRELFVDRMLIDTLEGGQLRLQTPHDEGPVLQFDRPWEGRFCGYVTILASHGDRDEPRFRAYYRGLPAASAEGQSEQVTCLAVSDDGTCWVKPNLGLFEYGGDRHNNIVLAGGAPATHNFSPFLDARPDVPARERFKALGGSAKSGLVAYVSADGIHWNKLQEGPVFTDEGWVFDSQNVSFWSASEGSYLLYYRKSADGRRAIARATSPDFVHWSAPVMMVYSDTRTSTPSHHLYTNQTSPYFRAPHIYIATAARFMPGRQVLTPEQAQAIGVDPKYFGDVSDAVLMTSRGGNRYEWTFGAGFLRPGIGLENWVSRTNYPALNVVQTGPHEMSMYVNQNYGQPTAHLRRYSLRLDGFASVHAPTTGAELITKPLSFAGNQLRLNFASSAAGGIRVELQDLQGRAVSGFGLRESQELVGNEIARRAEWHGRRDLSTLAGRPVRLRFQMQDADLYSFQFLAAP